MPTLREPHRSRIRGGIVSGDCNMIKSIACEVEKVVDLFSSYIVSVLDVIDVPLDDVGPIRSLSCPFSKEVSVLVRGELSIDGSKGDGPILSSMAKGTGCLCGMDISFSSPRELSSILLNLESSPLLTFYPNVIIDYDEVEEVVGWKSSDGYRVRVLNSSQHNVHVSSAGFRVSVLVPCQKIVLDVFSELKWDGYDRDRSELVELIRSFEKEGFAVRGRLRLSITQIL